MSNKTEIQRINDRGWATGWHAERLAAEAKSQGKTMAALFSAKAAVSSAFNVPAKAVKIKGGKVHYQFLDGSTDAFLHQKRP